MSTKNAARRVAVSLAIATAAAVTGGGLNASAATSGAIQGSFAVFPAPAGIQIQQLFTGSDGQLWFVTTESQLGRITSDGDMTLTGVTLPHGQYVAQIAGAGPEGVWSFSNSYTYPPPGGGCAVGLVTPDGVLHSIALPAGPVRNQSVCGGGVADASGNLWLSLDAESCANPCRSGVVDEITPSGSSTIFQPARPGARPTAMALGSNDAIWTLQGFRQQNLVSYTTAGVASSSVFGSQARALFARPDGSFWIGTLRDCPGHAVCDGFWLFDPTTSTTVLYRIFPVGVPRSAFGPQLTFAVDAGGSLWAAGDERSQPDRLFHLGADGTVNRSAALAVDGTPLMATGPLAITPSGDVWASAVSAAGTAYLVRYLPLS
jgi:streptogramin lyase